MNTEQMTPTPPPGMRLLTPEELTKPLPMDAVCFPKYGKDGMWSQSGYRGGFPDEQARTEFFYATATPPQTDWRKLVEELTNVLESERKVASQRSGHRMMQIAQPARETINRITPALTRAKEALKTH